MDDLELHRPLIGQQGSRASLNTPVLVLDADVLDRNIARMAALAAQAGVALRPHACLLYTSPSPRDRQKSRMPSSA